MSTIKRVGWALIYASIASWILDAIVGSVQMLHGTFDLPTMIVWTYCTLPFLTIGIYMAQYEPYNEEE